MKSEFYHPEKELSRRQLIAMLIYAFIAVCLIGSFWLMCAEAAREQDPGSAPAPVTSQPDITTP